MNGRFLMRRMTGVDRFAREILWAMDALLGAEPSSAAASSASAASHRWTVVVPPGEPADPLPAYRHMDVIARGPLQGQLWEQTTLAWVSRDGLLLSLCNTAPALRRQQMVVIHDAATARVPQSYGRSFRRWYRVLMPWLGRMARRVITVSAFSRGELSAVFGIAPHKIGQVNEGCEHMLRAAPDDSVLKRFGIGQRPFFLAVGSPVPHKNFALLLRALHGRGDPGFDVAIVGGVDRRVFAQGSAAEATDEAQPAVHWLGYRTDSELRALYGHATAFLFPSRYEGFGLPPIEAMICGCPVIAARAASMPEVCGDAALLVDPDDPAAWFAAMCRLRDDVACASRLRAAAQAVVSRMNWPDAARAMLAEIDTVLATPVGPGRRSMPQGHATLYGNQRLP